MSEQQPEIYKLKLHEQIEVRVSTGPNGRDFMKLEVMRVPGGWIYGTTFVPFHNEYQTKEF